MDADVACTSDWAGTEVVAAGRLAAAAAAVVVDDAWAAVADAAVGKVSHPSCRTAFLRAAEAALAADTLLCKQQQILDPFPFSFSLYFVQK